MKKRKPALPPAHVTLRQTAVHGVNPHGEPVPTPGRLILQPRGT